MSTIQNLQSFGKAGRRDHRPETRCPPALRPRFVSAPENGDHRRPLPRTAAERTLRWSPGCAAASAPCPGPPPPGFRAPTLSRCPNPAPTSRDPAAGPKPNLPRLLLAGVRGRAGHPLALGAVVEQLLGALRKGICHRAAGTGRRAVSGQSGLSTCGVICKVTPLGR